MLLETQYPETSATVGGQPLSETEAAARLGLKVPTLRAWRARGRGPAYIRLGRAIRYLPADIDDFLQSNRHQPRSDASTRSIE